MKPVVIIPTLNENDNIAVLIKKILKSYPEMHIIVVDGNSTDGTQKTVGALSAWNEKIHLVIQDKESGYGRGLALGFKTALEKEFDPVITMDGDLSHDPVYFEKLLEFMPKYSLVIASRYINGVRVEGWQFRKLLLSKLANMYVSYVLVKPIWDFTSGFRCYSRRFLKSVPLDELHPQAYIVQIQLLHLAYQSRFRVKEIPFLFREIHPGHSKVGRHSVGKTFLYVLKYRAPLLEILRHLAYLRKDYQRFIKEYEELMNPPHLKYQERPAVKDKYTVSIGVMAHNEEKLIGRCLDALLNQRSESAIIEEIFVISSGSTDKTDEIVMDYINKYPHVRLIVQSRRMGKASAINEFLTKATGDIAIIESADTVTTSQTVEELVKPFRRPGIGMTGAHPVPVNKKNRFVGFCVHKLWDLHHAMAMESPKCGEMIAFRNMIQNIPNYTAVDEAAIEALIVEQDYDLAYSPKAVVYNKGPETMKDFIKQRRRIASGHRHLQATMGYKVASKSGWRMLKLVIRTQRWTPRQMWYMFWLIIIEVYCRLAGAVDFYIRDKNPFIWDISKTTKRM